MKNKKRNFVSLVAIFVAMVFIHVGCNDDDQVENSKSVVKSPNALEGKQLDPNYKMDGARVADATCGTNYGDSWSGIGTHTYDIPLNLSSVSDGATVTISLNAYDNPNRVRVLRNGSSLVSSSWIGCTTNGGWWGSPFCTTDFTAISFVKSSGTYLIKVDTETKTISDAFSITVSCPTCSDGVKNGLETGIDCGAPGCPACPPACVSSCGKHFSGSTAALNSYTYPLVPLAFCAPFPTKVFVQATSNDVPNRFTVYDNNNVQVVSTGWFGYSTHGGPWGTQLQVTDQKTVSFTYNPAKTYYVKIETYRISGDNIDAQNMTILCN